MNSTANIGKGKVAETRTDNYPDFTEKQPQGSTHQFGVLGSHAIDPTSRLFNNQTLSLHGKTLQQTSTAALTKIIVFLLDKFNEETRFIQSNSKAIDLLQATNSIGEQKLVKLKYLLNFQCFQIANRKIQTNFFKSEQILLRLSNVVKLLNSLYTRLETESESHILTFFEEAECYRCFVKLFGQEPFSQEYGRKLFSEIWKLIRNHPRPLDLQAQHFEMLFERYYLFLYGISLPSAYAADYPLHKAIFESDLPLIRKLCTGSTSSNFYSHIEQADPLGITPLMLAVKLDRKDIVLILAEHGADPKHRCIPYTRTPLEEAISNKQQEILRILLVISHHQQLMRWDHSKNEIMDILEKMPDFSFDISWECDSKYIPFVKKLTPSDTYKIYKKGSNLRMDMTLLGWEKLKLLRGNVSILLQGRGSGKHEGQLLKVDNVQRTVSNLLTEINLKKLEKELDRLIKQEAYSSEIKSENIHFDPAKNWRGDSVVQKLESYTVTKYNAKGTFSLMYTKKNSSTRLDLSKFQSFEEYFTHCLQNQVWNVSETPSRAEGFASQIDSIIDAMNCDKELIENLFGKEMVGKLKDKKAQKSKMKASQLDAAEKKVFKQIKKNVVASVWVCDQFPLNFDHLLPVLDILSSASPYIQQLKDFLERKSLLRKGCFPLKATIPLFHSVNAIICFKNFSFSVDKIKSIHNECMQSGSGDADECLEDSPQLKKGWAEYANPTGNNQVISNQQGQEAEEEFRDQVYEGSEGSPESFCRTNREVQSFFKKNVKASIANQDYFNIFEEERLNNEIGGIAGLDLAEKFRDETLKIFSQKLHTPKSIAYLDGKFTPSGRSATYSYDNHDTSPNNFTEPRNLDLINNNLLKKSTMYQLQNNDNQEVMPEKGLFSHGGIAGSKNINSSFDVSRGPLYMQSVNNDKSKKQALRSKENLYDVLPNVKETNEDPTQAFYEESEQENIPTEMSIDKQEPRKLYTKNFNNHQLMRLNEEDL